MPGRSFLYSRDSRINFGYLDPLGSALVIIIQGGSRRGGENSEGNFLNNCTVMNYQEILPDLKKLSDHGKFLR